MGPTNSEGIPISFRKHTIVISEDENMQIATVYAICLKVGV